MGDLFIQLCVLLIVLAPIASFAWQFHRVRRGLGSRVKAIVMYAVYSVIPVLVYLAIFLALIGLEELLQTSLVSEGYARSILFVGAAGAAMVIVGTILFSVVVMFGKSKAT